ncbi:hypothetical protein LTR95_010395 [Oleoguttula sp. CCFEE 5521]
MAPDDPLDLTEYYFERVNHIFPIVNKELLLKKLFDRTLKPAPTPDAFDASDTKFSHIAKAGSLALAAYLRDLTEPPADAALPRSERMAELFNSAQSCMGELVTASPSIPGVQALLMLCVNMLNTSKQLEGAAALIAAVVRQAQSLRLHVLNQVEGLSPLERLAQIRLFWCMYILDKELSMRMQTPPLMDDRDLFVLEPREIGDFARWSHHAESVHYAAKTCAGAKSDLDSHIEGAASKTEVNAALVAWQERWFAGGAAVIRKYLWPKWASLHIARLHFAYFSSLLLANPSESSTDVVVPPCEVLEAARTTFVAGKLVHHGGTAWMTECLDVHVSAALVLMQAIIASSGEPSAHRDFMTVEVWLQVSEQIADTTTLAALRYKTRDLAEFRKLAAVALGLEHG